VPWPKPPWVSRWFLLGVLCFAAFLACGFFYVSSHPGAGGWPRDYMRKAFLTLFLLSLDRVLPELLAVAMIWIAFARPQWSDRLLWSAAMVLTSIELASLAATPYHNYSANGTPFNLYPDPTIVSGLVAYGSLLAVVARAAAPRWQILLACAGAAGILLVVALPLFTNLNRPIELAGSALFAAACWSFGVAVAERLGVDLFRRDDAGETESEA
jgi:hypothetical protein